MVDCAEGRWLFKNLNEKLSMQMLRKHIVLIAFQRKGL